MKSTFLSDFKKFAMRGNVIDLAVGVIIGAAFGKIVSSLVSDIVMPFIGTIMGGVNFADLSITLKGATLESEAVLLKYGNFLQTTVDFLIIAFSVFMAIRVINKLTEKRKAEEEAAPAPAEPSDEVKLLGEIRDLLKKEGK